MINKISNLCSSVCRLQTFFFFSNTSSRQRTICVSTQLYFSRLLCSITVENYAITLIFSEITKMFSHKNSSQDHQQSSTTISFSATVLLLSFIFFLSVSILHSGKSQVSCCSFLTFPVRSTDFSPLLPQDHHHCHQTPP